MAKAATQLEASILEMADMHPRVGALFKFNVLYRGAGRVFRACPTGWPDLAGWMADGRALLVEVKTSTDNLRKHQEEFLAAARQRGAVAGVARSVEDFVQLVEEVR